MIPHSIFMCCDYIKDDRDKIRLLSVCKDTLTYIHKLELWNKVCMDKILLSPYLHIFRCVSVSHSSQLSYITNNIKSVYLSPDYDYTNNNLILDNVNSLTIECGDIIHNHTHCLSIPKFNNLKSLIIPYCWHCGTDTASTSVSSLVISNCGFNKNNEDIQRRRSKYRCPLLSLLLVNIENLSLLKCIPVINREVPIGKYGYKFNVQCYQVEVPYTFVKLKSLIVGDGCLTSGIPSTITNLQSLTFNDAEFDLSPTLTSLTYLNFRNSRYESPLPNTFTNLKVLHMGNNYKQTIPIELRNLEEITLGEIYTSASLLKSFTKLTQLTWLCNVGFVRCTPPSLINLIVRKSYNSILPQNVNIIRI